MTDGSSYAANATALAAKAGLTTGYLDAAGRTPFTEVASNLGGRTLTPGVYRNAALQLTGTVTLDAQGDAGAVFIFQSGASLITASSSTVVLTGDAQACNVVWQVGSSATLGTHSTFVGNVLALTSITAQTGATISGRLLARNREVSLDANVISRPSCSASTIPTGAPETGFGGAATSSNNTLVWFGGAALLSGTACFVVAIRRSRRARTLTDTSSRN